MPDPNSSPTEAAERELVITRVFDAPCELVFKAWTEPERLMSWWGPRGWTLPVCTIDLRPGGVWHYCMRGPAGEESWGKAVYREITPPERLVYTDSFSDAEGNLVEPAHYGLSPGFPRETLVTVTFEERDGKTALTLRCAVGSASDTEREMAQQGWSESFDKLAEALENQSEETL